MVVKKAFFYSLFILFIFSTLSFSSDRSREELFSKIGVQPINGNPEAPNFSLEDLEGKKLDLKSLKGKVVFLNFWATWCGPCRGEMPSMEALWQQFKGKDFIFLTISVDYDGRKSVMKFIAKHHYTFPVLLDPKYEILDLYRVKGIPTTFIIDKKGRVIGRAVGSRNWKKPEVISILNDLLIER